MAKLTCTTTKNGKELFQLFTNSIQDIIRGVKCVVTHNDEPYRDYKTEVIITLHIVNTNNELTWYATSKAFYDENDNLVGAYIKVNQEGILYITFIKNDTNDFIYKEYKNKEVVAFDEHFPAKYAHDIIFDYVEDFYNIYKAMNNGESIIKEEEV